ncbi:potassium/proton antiporter [Lachnoclostridium sp. Marseille-P6806]|uniref:potassium/proton antiporter n=1 Tax=Lachnoclostridium sp. Marseille-P6806 TaxID=2364793 RepID=UPI00102F9682|nr:potassium/proton antiporter [Lachnoclostridium sp. Marseille-P6806]
MTNLLLLASVVIFACVLLHRLSARLGIPMLLAFIVLGMLFGSDGIFKIPFENYSFAENVCSFALIFIMFYGGFGTSWRQARPSAGKAALLSTLGVLFTALLTGAFCHLVLRLDWLPSLLGGAVVSSTDAASVFSILRYRRLGLKENTASLLELESGSNDPMSYMLTVAFIAMINGQAGPESMFRLLFLQLVLGAAVGFAAAFFALFLLHHIRFDAAGFDMVFVAGAAIASYAAAAAIEGNGYLATYITGIVLGNRRLRNKKELVHFFDGLTALMQMLLFFLLGLLSAPARLPAFAGQAILIFLFLTFLARPAAVFTLLAPFGCRPRQILLISFAGLRGAASIVFAILAVQGTSLGDTVFHITFFIVLLSILLQGSLLPWAANHLGMVDSDNDVMKTFTDYSEDMPVQFIEFSIPEQHVWAGKTLREIELPPGTLAVLSERNGSSRVPNGDTVLCPGDRIVLGAAKPGEQSRVLLSEQVIRKNSEYIGKPLSALPKEENCLVILIERGMETIIPGGDVRLREGDILVLNRGGEKD